MISKLIVPAAIAALALPNAVFAHPDSQNVSEKKLGSVEEVLAEEPEDLDPREVVEPLTETSAIRARVMTGLAKPASLTRFDGTAAILKKAGRRRIVLSSLGYKLTVGSDGQPTACELTYKYRSKATANALCNVLMSHHSFEPARDSAGNAVEGSYENRLYYRKLRDELEAAKLADKAKDS